MYMLFTYNSDNPKGGMNDFKGVFDSVSMAIEHMKENHKNDTYYQIVMCSNLQVILKGAI